METLGRTVCAIFQISAFYINLQSTQMGRAGLDMVMHTFAHKDLPEQEN